MEKYCIMGLGVFAMDAITELVLTIGFPAAIAIYLLVRIEPVMRGIRDAILLLSACLMKSGDIDFEKVQEVYERLNKS